MDIQLPYGEKKLTVSVPDRNLAGVILPTDISPEKEAREMILSALERPLGSLPLREIARGRKDAVIVVDDNTRPCPTWEMMPSVLEILNGAGIPDEKITVIFATGTHRTVRDEEAERLLGKEAASRLKYMSNDCHGDDFTYVGTTSRGTAIEVKKAYLNADLKILLGDVEIHYFAGYGGGRKSILPGICSYKTIQENYIANFFSHTAAPGVLDGNPMYENMTEAARLTPPDITLNVVQNSRHEIVGAFAGDFDMVLRKGAEVIDRMYKVGVKERADIVIAAADGNPHDINMYQAYKAIHLSLPVLKERGRVILVAACPDGMGSRAYEEWLKMYDTPEEVEAALRKEFIPGGHKVYFQYNAIKKARISMVTEMPKETVEGLLRFEYEENVQKALNTALKEYGEDSRVFVIPRATTTLSEWKE